MTIQSNIDAVDGTKPVDFSPTQKPSIKSIRDNFVSLKSAVQGLLDLVGTLSSPSLSSLVLTGVDFTVSTAIVATDNALIALGKLQAQINGKQAALGFTPYNATNPSGYTANQSDSYLLDRSHHAGTQLSATISDFNSAALAATASKAVASSGTTGQVLTKNSATDNDVGWTTVSGGGGSDPVINIYKFMNF